VGTKQEAKCLGYWWKSNLGADKPVEANIEKKKEGLLAAGAISAYQGNLNPLSSTSLFHTCVVPTLLYGGSSLNKPLQDLKYFSLIWARGYSRSQSTMPTHYL